jgi:hypothetical protein
MHVEEGWLDPWRGGEEACLEPPWSGGSGRHGVGERVTAAAVEKKRANGGGAVEAPASAMQNEEPCVTLFYFIFVFEELCMRARSRLCAGPQA